MFWIPSEAWILVITLQHTMFKKTQLLEEWQREVMWHLHMLQSTFWPLNPNNCTAQILNYFLLQIWNFGSSTYHPSSWSKRLPTYSEGHGDYLLSGLVKIAPFIAPSFWDLSCNLTLFFLKRNGWKNTLSVQSSCREKSSSSCFCHNPWCFMMHYVCSFASSINLCIISSRAVQKGLHALPLNFLGALRAVCWKRTPDALDLFRERKAGWGQ